MQKLSDTFLFILATGLLLVGLTATSAMAGPYGTTAGDSIQNAKSADTLPSAPGELSVKVQSTDGTDTTYVDTSTVVSTTVDTGFDMTAQSNIASALSDADLSTGDTRVVKFLLANRGNNAAPVPFDLHHLTNSDSTTTKADSFTLELFHEGGDVAFDTGSATRVSGSDGTVNFNEGDTKSIFLVISPKDNALPGDTVQSEVFLTDNAPVSNGTPGTTGDQWEDGIPISGQDTNDTQYHDFTTTLTGSNIKVKKSLNLVSGSARPGDTIEYTITAWNDGNNPADTVIIADALPDSTVYLMKSSADTIAGNSLQSGRSDVDGAGASGLSFSSGNYDFSESGNNENLADGFIAGSKSEGDTVPSVNSVFLALDEIKSIVNGFGPNPGDDDTVQFSYRVVIE